MNFKRIPPPDKLVTLVESFWILESNEDKKDYLDFKEFSFFASPFPQIVFQYNGNGFLDVDLKRPSIPIPASHFYGQSSKPINLVTAGSFGLFGVNLYPYSVPVLFGISSENTTGKIIDLESIFGQHADKMNQKVLSLENNAERLNYMATVLVSLASKGSKRDPIIEAAVHFLISNMGRESVDGLCKYLGYSARQIERSFKEKIGISPKLYARMIRFHFAMHNYRLREYENLGQLALDSGYSDQAHFIRDFKKFSGLNPRKFFKVMESKLSFVKHTI